MEKLVVEKIVTETNGSKIIISTDLALADAGGDIKLSVVSDGTSNKRTISLTKRQVIKLIKELEFIIEDL